MELQMMDLTFLSIHTIMNIMFFIMIELVLIHLILIMTNEQKKGWHYYNIKVARI